MVGTYPTSVYLIDLKIHHDKYKAIFVNNRGEPRVPQRTKMDEMSRANCFCRRANLPSQLEQTLRIMKQLGVAVVFVGSMVVARSASAACTPQDIQNARDAVTAMEAELVPDPNVPPVPGRTVSAYPLHVDIAIRYRRIEAHYERYLDILPRCIQTAGPNGQFGGPFAPHAVRDVHKNGAYASWAFGDIQTALTRFDLAALPTLRADLLARYGEVHLDFRQAPAPRYLTPPNGNTFVLGQVYNGSQVANRAYRAISLAGKFHGYLPPGTYMISGRTFVVSTLQPVTASY